MIRNIIVAVADNMAIGRDGQLLWHLKADMKYFRETTTGHPIIMGRKTWDSIGRPLPGRLNIVVSRSVKSLDGAVCCTSLQEAFKAAEDSGAQECFIIGGAQIYRETLPEADRLYITKVHCRPDGADSFFPEIDTAVWKEEWRSGRGLEGKYEYEFVIYSR